MSGASSTHAIFKVTAEGVVFNCRVRPRSSKSGVVGVLGDALKISLKAPPVDGKANAELIKFLGKTLGVSRASVNILRGHSSRDKRVAVAGVSIARCQETFDRIVG